jgi:DNA-binding NarL/FixJ family response regulator
VALDIAMPGRSGLQVARDLVTRWPRARIIMLTMHGQQGYVEQALRAGASGFVLKLADVDELRLAIRTVADGQSYVSALTPASAGRRPSPLTPRQVQVLKLFAEGLTASEVAERLNIEPRTAHHHRAAIKRMLGLHTNAALVRYAISEGLIE